MTNTTLLYAGILLIGVFLSAISQVMLKKAAARQYVSKLRVSESAGYHCVYNLCRNDAA